MEYIAQNSICRGPSLYDPHWMHMHESTDRQGGTQTARQTVHGLKPGVAVVFRAQMK